MTIETMRENHERTMKRLRKKLTLEVKRNNVQEANQIALEKKNESVSFQVARDKLFDAENHGE
jgi:hypothetical protein